MSKRSDKMYKDGPTITTDEAGKKVVTKGARESSNTDSATDGMAEHETHALDMGQKHEKEHLELNQKHEKERHELRAKHMKQISTKAEPKVENKSAGEVDRKGEKHEGGHAAKKEEDHVEKKTTQSKGEK